MEVTVLKRDKDIIILDWSENGSLGRVTIEYNGSGKYLIDSEYIGMDRLVKILSKID